jgi:hypothetical protein
LVVKFEYHASAVAAIQRVPGRQWNPEGKFWTGPDTPEARKVVGEIAAMPRAEAGQVIAVKPKTATSPPQKARTPYIPGQSKPLTTNPPHPLIKVV